MSILNRLFSKPKAPLRATQEFLLDLNSPVSGMKRVYMLTEELRSDPKRVELTHALTLNSAKPNRGLKGEHGLFATEEWWDSINTRKMPLEYVSGVVVEEYEAGQDHEGVSNTVTLKLSNDTTTSVGIYTNGSEDVGLFRVGHAASIVYALDKLESQPAIGGGTNYSKVALEMLVSIQPVGAKSAA